MFAYLKTKKGRFPKFKKNGKKSLSQSSKKSKARKNKKVIGGGGEPIEESDIIFQDGLVCILKPDVKKGIIVWHHYEQPPDMDSLCEFGLKTGAQLQSEGVDFGRTTIHPHIFFRAPYLSRDIDYSTPENEIFSSFGKDQIGKEPRVFIRVDPDNTYVFSSEIRPINPSDINRSKKLLSEYLMIIAENLEIERSSTFYMTDQPAYNLFTSRLVKVPYRPAEKASGTRRGRTRRPIYNHNIGLRYPLVYAPIERNSEILVSLPHLTREYFVLCT